MPMAKEVEVAPPAAAPVRLKAERDCYVGSMIANKPPIHDDAAMPALSRRPHANDACARLRGVRAAKRRRSPAKRAAREETAPGA